MIYKLRKKGVKFVAGTKNNLPKVVSGIYFLGKNTISAKIKKKVFLMRQVTCTKCCSK